MSIYKTTWAKLSTALLISAVVTASCNDTADKATTTVQSTDTTKTVTAPATTTTTTTTTAAAPDTTIVNVTRKTNKKDTSGRTIKNPGKMIQK